MALVGSIPLIKPLMSHWLILKQTHGQRYFPPLPFKDENGRKTPQPFSTFTFEYENKTKNGKAGHENEHEFMEYWELWKRNNSSEIMLNTVDIRKFNMEYRSTMHNN
jgi:hypothetical protein